LHHELREQLREGLRAEGDRHAALLREVTKRALERGEAVQRAITDRGLRWELTPLVRICEKLVKIGALEQAADLAGGVAGPLISRGRYEEARRCLEQALKIREEERGGEGHLDAARIHIDLGRLRYEQGCLQKAQEHFERALAICEQA